MSESSLNVDSSYSKAKAKDSVTNSVTDSLTPIYGKEVKLN